MAKKPRDFSQINWEDIRLFLAVSQSGSIRNAAKRLNMHHSAVARRIAQFEATLNQPLININPSNRAACELTSNGEQIAEAAKEMTFIVNRISALLDRGRSKI